MISELTPELTMDDFLGGEVSLVQHKKGYRITMDSVLLAAAVPVAPGEHVLDLGCGSGAVAVCLATRISDIRVTGLELQSPMADLARQNVVGNNLENQVEIIDGDVSDPPPKLEEGKFDHVVTNPPYVTAGGGTLPPDPVKAIARVESHASLPVWVDLAARMVRPGGTFTVVHRADRCNEILSSMSGEFGDMIVYPLWPGPERSVAYKRVIIQGTRGGHHETATRGGIVIHTRGGGYTPEAEDILRNGSALSLA